MVDEREGLVAVGETGGEVAELRALCARVAVGKPDEVAAAWGKLASGRRLQFLLGFDERVFLETTWQVDKGWLFFSSPLWEQENIARRKTYSSPEVTSTPR